MNLSKEEKRRVRKALARRISVQKLQTPLEYHYFAWHWNWDNGIKPLEWIIRQPTCDQGTALLIYWYASPTWFCQYRDRREVKLGLDVLHATFPDIGEQSGPDEIVAAVMEYVTLAKASAGKQVSFDGPQAQVGWLLTRQIESKYHWTWQVYSFDDGDTERLALMSPDNVLIVAPPNSVVLSIRRWASGEGIGAFFDLLGSWSQTQDFRKFYALNWMTFVRR